MTKTEYMRQWREKNREHVNREARKNYLKNKDKIAERGKAYRLKEKENLSRKSSERYLNNKEEIKRRTKEYKAANKEKISERNKIYYKENKSSIQQYAKENRQKITKQENERRKADINFKIKKNLRTRMWTVLNKNKKVNKTIELLGCSVEQLKIHLESKFKDGMTWDNYGKEGWTIDHILPCASFDLSQAEEQKKCFHYSNLQPLWSIENSQKSAKIIL